MSTPELNDLDPSSDKQVDERDLARRAEAEDVTSEVFHRALVAMPRFEPRRPFLAFLYTIARNVITDRTRRERPHASFEDALAHPSDAPGPEELASAGDEVRRLRAAVAQLTTLQQEVIVLRYLEGRSTKETAVLLAALRDLVGDLAP